jgi:DivIVA domain-containing protein
VEPSEIEHAEFPLALRGYDPQQVRTFLAEVASEFRSAKATKTPADQLGHRISAILNSAEQAAEDLTSSANFKAEEIRKAAVDEAARTNNAAMRQLDEANRIREQAEKDAEAIRGAARSEADRIENEAQKAAASLEKEAREYAASIEHEARLKAASLERAASANVTGVLSEARTRYERLRAAEEESLTRLVTVESLIRNARESVESAEPSEGLDGLIAGVLPDTQATHPRPAYPQDEAEGA